MRAGQSCRHGEVEYEDITMRARAGDGGKKAPGPTYALLWFQDGFPMKSMCLEDWNGSKAQPLAGVTFGLVIFFCLSELLFPNCQNGHDDPHSSGYYAKNSGREQGIVHCTQPTTPSFHTLL